MSARDENAAARTNGWRETALGIARNLASAAVWDDGMCAFHGALPPESRASPPRFGSVGGDVYEGSAGIARFLAHAAVIANEPASSECARGAMRHAIVRTTGWSLFTGGLGVGLAALEIGERLDTPELVDAGARLVDEASVSALADAAPYDLLVGTAGVIVGLLAAHRHDRGERWLARAVDLGESLLTAAVSERPDDPDESPLSWPLAVGAPERLCGLAHGASGIALAFERLARRLPEEAKWRNAARRARAYERGHYSQQEGSWADLRSPEPGAPAAPAGYPHMWCHGSIGVVAERLGVLEHDLLARADAVGGLAGTRAHAERLLALPLGPAAGDEANASVCHGVSGLIDLFMDAWDATADTDWLVLARDLADLMKNDARRAGGWRSGIPGGWPAPGLMLGYAGMGWTLLRVADPERTGSVWRFDALGTRAEVSGETREATATRVEAVNRST
jgi:lantibiotic biosynthesis protein